MRTRRPAIVCLAIAVAVHLGLLLVARPRQTGAVPPASPDEIVEAEVISEEPPPAEPPSPPAAPDRAAASVKGVPSKPSAPKGELAMIVGAGREGEANEASPEPPTPEGDGKSGAGAGWTLQPGPSVDVTSRDVLARATRSIVERDAQDKGGETWGIGDALDAHDSAVGLGRGGPVVTALENALGAADAPFEGAATFDVAIQTDGRVSMSLVDASDGAESWRRMGQATERTFDPKQVRIPPGTRGWHVIVRLEAKVEYPNGLDPKTLGPKVTKTPTSVEFAVNGKVCSVRLVVGLTLSPIAGSCSPENIGARPLRVIHGHVVREGRL